MVDSKGCAGFGGEIRHYDLNVLSLRGKKRVFIKHPSGNGEKAAGCGLEFMEAI